MHAVPEHAAPEELPVPLFLQGPPVPLQGRRHVPPLSRGDDPQQVAAQLAHTITNKLIHAPTAGLKAASAAGREDLLVNARRLLGLPVNKADAPAQVDPEATAGASASPLADNDSNESEAGRTLQ